MLLVTRLGDRPDFVCGRLLPPYGTSSAGIVLDLKNGAHPHPRRVEVHFYDGAGGLAASSDRFALAPPASLSRPAADFIATGSWSAGSIEVFYCGRGGARVFGQAVTTENGVGSIVPLQQAGLHRRER
jgi:hypothetical protein